MKKNTTQHPWKRIGVFRALQLGDLLCAIPAVRAIRYNYPLAEITLIGLPWQKMLTDRYPAYFDEFLSFPGYPGLPEQPFDREAYDFFLTEVRKNPFDLLIQLQGNGTVVNEMLAEWRPRQLAGFHPPGETAPGPFFIPYPDRLSEPDRHLRLMKHLEMEISGNQLEFPLYPEDRMKMQFLPGFRPGAPYVCVHPGSRAGWRQWPTACFARLADAAAEQGYQVFITGTTGESAITSAVLDQMHYPAIDLTGRTDLGTLASLVRGAAFLIANCTGVSHLASATGTPSIIISMDGEPERWSPTNHRLHKVIDLRAAPSAETVLDEALEIVNRHSWEA